MSTLFGGFLYMLGGVLAILLVMLVILLGVVGTLWLVYRAFTKEVR